MILYNCHGASTLRARRATASKTRPMTRQRKSDARGDLFALVQRLEPSFNFGDVRKTLRRFVGVAPHRGHPHSVWVFLNLVGYELSSGEPFGPGAGPHLRDRTWLASGFSAG